MGDYDHLLNDSANSVFWEGISFLEDFDELDFDSSISTVEVGTDRNPAPAHPPNAKKKGPKESVIVKCVRCPNRYKTVGGYAEHMKTHVWEDLQSQLPSVGTFSSWASELAPQALQDLRKALVGMDGPTQYVQHLVDNCASPEWAQFVDLLVLRLFSPLHQSIANMPHIFVERAQSSVVKFLGTADTRAEALFFLGRCHPEEAPPVVVSVVCQKLLFRLMELVTAQHLKTIKAVTALEQPRRQITMTQKTKKVIYHSAGSTVKGLLRMGFMYRHNVWWNTVTQVTKQFFIAGTSAAPPVDDASTWTDILNRGGLTSISQNALTFFMSVGQILAAKEKTASIASHDELIEAVYKDAKLMMEWDTVLQGSLPRDESLHLMFYVCIKFCNTFSRGIIKKRKNAVQRSANVPLRCQMAVR